MTTITKTEAEAILERLTDKSLTFGCEFKCTDAYGDDTILTFCSIYDDTNCTKTLAYLTPDHERTKEIFDFDKFDGSLEILGHPVTMLDVLAKMDERKRNGGEQSLLMLQWREFGFKTTLQDILEGATWQDLCTEDHGWGEDCVSVPVLKDAKVEALFLFLKQIGL